jgi:hypothetical protein
MGYLVYGVVAAIAVVLFIFTGVFGGLAWLIVAGLAAAVIFIARGRMVETSRVEPTGTPRSSHGSVETSNERVGQT